MSARRQLQIDGRWQVSLTCTRAGNYRVVVYKYVMSLARLHLVGQRAR